MIKMIGWDLGKVVVDFDYRTDVLRRIIEGFGGQVGPVFQAFGFDDGTVEATYERLDTGQISYRSFWEMICQKGEISPDKMPIELFTLLFMHHLKVFPVVVELVRKLQQRYKIVAVSNGGYEGRYLYELLRIEYGIQWAEEFVSAEHRVKKPGLLDKVVAWFKEQGIEAREAVFVDDIQEYVDGALERQFGGAILFDGSKESAEFLAQQLVTVGVCLEGGQ